MCCNHFLEKHCENCINQGSENIFPNITWGITLHSPLVCPRDQSSSPPISRSADHDGLHPNRPPPLERAHSYTSTAITQNIHIKSILTPAYHRHIPSTHSVAHTHCVRMILWFQQATVLRVMQQILCSLAVLRWNGCLGVTLHNTVPRQTPCQGRHYATAGTCPGSQSAHICHGGLGGGWFPRLKASPEPAYA